MLKRIVARIIKFVVTLIMVIGALHPRLGKIFWHVFYDFIGTRLSQGLDEFDFLNYGYATLDSQEEKLELEEQDETYRLNIQLYHHVATAATICDRDVLEVGCGHGGGASYTMRYLQPKKMVGIDLSVKNIEICNKRHTIEGLTFQKGDAEDLPFDDHSFDVVLNVESSHAYSSMEKFLSEVRRVLRPGGHFLFADLRRRNTIPTLQKQLLESGMDLLKEEEITSNVLKARDLFTQQAADMIRNRMTLFGSFTLSFLGTKGSKIYQCLQDGRFKYLAFALKKPEEPSTYPAD